MSARAAPSRSNAFRAVNTPSPLTPAQLQAAKLLGAGKGPTEVAAAVGVSRATLGRWRKRDVFLVAVDQATEQTLASADGIVAEGRDEILRLTSKSAAAIERALEAESYVIDGDGQMHTFPAHRVQLKAAELQLRVAALLVTKLEHTGELQLSRMSDEELDDAIRRLGAAIEE